MLRVAFMAAAVVVGAPQALAAGRDSDLDGLTDEEESVYGTCKNDNDTDSDGLPDGWEVKGLGSRAGRLDLKALGADPLRKDIFVEMDYMVRPSGDYELRPSPAVLARLTAIFDNAEVENYDCRGRQVRKGIALHLDLDDAIPHDASLDPYIVEFAALRKKHFTQSRKLVYRYMVWADQSPRLLGVALGIPHSDFIVALGSINGGSDDEKVGTFLHELGHTLGLRHGGCTHVNYKPNHLSAMNYAYVDGWPGRAQEIDLQRVSTELLDESSLDEARGLRGGVILAGRKLAICQTCGNVGDTLRELSVSPDGWIDWNRNGRKDPERVAADLDGDGAMSSEFCGWANEWEMLVYQGGLIGYSGTLAGDNLDKVWSDRSRPMGIREISPDEYLNRKIWGLSP